MVSGIVFEWSSCDHFKMGLSLLLFGGQVLTTFQKQSTPLLKGGQGGFTPIKEWSKPPNKSGQCQTAFLKAVLSTIHFKGLTALFSGRLTTLKITVLFSA